MFYNVFFYEFFMSMLHYIVYVFTLIKVLKKRKKTGNYAFVYFFMSKYLNSKERGKL